MTRDYGILVKDIQCFHEMNERNNKLLLAKLGYSSSLPNTEHGVPLRMHFNGELTQHCEWQIKFVE